MTDMTLKQSTECSNIAGTDLFIAITPRAYAEFGGSADQLIAEGLVPAGFQWPTGRTRVDYEIGNFSCWLSRKRPDGHKGPMSSWTSGNHWIVRRSLTSRVQDGFREADLYALQSELAKAIFEGTAEGRDISNRSYRAKTDQRYMQFRSQAMGTPS